MAVEFKLPDLGENIEGGDVVKVLVGIGEEVDEDQSIIELETDKAVIEVPSSVRAVARCGAGTNNIPVDRMTERGIPVFNSPGANANAVKELALCALLLSSRGVVQSIHAVDTLLSEETDPKVIKKRVEGEKKRFGGCEPRR